MPTDSEQGQALWALLEKQDDLLMAALEVFRAEGGAADFGDT